MVDISIIYNPQIYIIMNLDYHSCSQLTKNKTELYGQQKKIRQNYIKKLKVMWRNTHTNQNPRSKFRNS